MRLCCLTASFWHLQPRGQDRTTITHKVKLTSTLLRVSDQPIGNLRETSLTYVINRTPFPTHVFAPTIYAGFLLTARARRFNNALKPLFMNSHV